MEEQSPFEFGAIYHFKNDEISTRLKDAYKFHIYVGSRKFFDEEAQEEETQHHFFLINSEKRKNYAPHHPIFKGDLPKKYPFLSYDSYVGCKRTFVEDRPPKDCEYKGKLNYKDMKTFQNYI